MSKTCTKCNKLKNITEFHRNKALKSGYTHWCAECISYYRNNVYKNRELNKEYQKNYREKNHKKLKKYYTKFRKDNRQLIRARALAYRYKISIEEAKKLYSEKLNGVCDICGKPETSKKFLLSVDHNHKTGKVRGLLCKNCNIALGYMQDNIDLLKNAIKYLKRTNNE